jgi:hypothetical protein
MTQTVTQQTLTAFCSTGMTTSSGQFTLDAGLYAFVASGTFGNSLSLAILGADGSTFVPVANEDGTAATLSANGYWTGRIPAGQYKLVASGTLTSVAAGVTRIDRTQP